jgi:hypothetical protein
MAKKKVFALRMDEEVYAAIERWAADEFRSVNGQMEWILDKALKDARRVNGMPPTGGDDEMANT